LLPLRVDSLPSTPLGTGLPNDHGHGRRACPSTPLRMNSDMPALQGGKAGRRDPAVQEGKAGYGDPALGAGGCRWIGLVSSFESDFRTQ